MRRVSRLTSAVLERPLILPHLLAGLFGTVASFTLYLPLGLGRSLLAAALGGAIGILLAGLDACAQVSAART
jgi:hypothetical protein